MNEHGKIAWAVVWRVLAVFLVALALGFAAGALLTPVAAPEARSSYATLCYREPGGAKWVCESGGEIELQSGATLDVQSGATFAPTMSGDITLENDETISNSTDDVVRIGGFVALDEVAVVEATAASTMTLLSSFQPITSAAVITNAAIADGAVAGQVVILTNENAADNITILESTNLKAGGNIQLDGGNDDGVILLWTGDEWIKVASFGDN